MERENHLRFDRTIEISISGAQLGRYLYVLVHDERRRSLRVCEDSWSLNIKMTERYAKLGRQHITKTSTTAKVIWSLMKKKPEQEEGDPQEVA